ncbi:hypothetical protein EJ06DRAFT_551998 [Trichodelitschia bisporula]|uniref:Uncharacterized protein n=1 Tax=Trichodelitschia bisporula TaxID=703511 RepID=A0A6G1HJJ2_9PEZI|nr:hypothetical protein EJ06DRAFT_551998 [Trichodelitschia bisporula]
MLAYGDSILAEAREIPLPSSCYGSGYSSKASSGPRHYPYKIRRRVADRMRVGARVEVEEVINQEYIQPQERGRRDTERLAHVEEAEVEGTEVEEPEEDETEEEDEEVVEMEEAEVEEADAEQAKETEAEEATDQEYMESQETAGEQKEWLAKL